MKSVSVIYRAPQGDSKVCEMFGFTFFDGQPVEIEDTPQNKHAIAKLTKNQLFELSEKGEVNKKVEEVEEVEEAEEPEHKRKHRR